MNALEVYLLGRTLVKLGEQALPSGAERDLPASVWTVLLDVVDHPDTSITEIAARTGFPQSHVSDAVARLRALSGALETLPDEADRRRTLVRATAQALPPAGGTDAASVEALVAAVIGTDDPGEVRQVVAALELLVRRLTPARLVRARAALPRR